LSKVPAEKFSLGQPEEVLGKVGFSVKHTKEEFGISQTFKNPRNGETDTSHCMIKIMRRIGETSATTE